MNLSDPNEVYYNNCYSRNFTVLLMRFGTHKVLISDNDMNFVSYLVYRVYME